jgi:hypothetical protein
MFIYVKKWASSISERLTSQAGHENGSQEEDVLYETAIHLDMRRHLFLFFFLLYIFCCACYPCGNPEAMLELVAANLAQVRRDGLCCVSNVTRRN